MPNVKFKVTPFFFVRISQSAKNFIQDYKQKNGFRGEKSFLLHCLVKLGYEIKEGDVK